MPSQHPEKEPLEGPKPGRLSGRSVGILTAESIALGIAIVAPITPSKTGSTWSPGLLLTEDPSYFHDVLASFILVNLLLIILGLVAWVVSRRSGSE
jgi:hypothetical protein